MTLDQRLQQIASENGYSWPAGEIAAAMRMAAKAALEWLPISSAPSYALVLVHYDKRITDLHDAWDWPDEATRTSVARFNGDFWEDEGGDLLIPPTHWMPLPGAPQ